MSFKFSLVVATYGRKQELDLLLASLVVQTFPKPDFEVIIVDQNENELISELVQNYSTRLQLKHIRSGRKGLSYNRNLGIKQATGAYIAVPDDDCEYYADTLEQAAEQLKKLNGPDMIIGRVFDRQRKTHVFKKTPEEITEVTPANFYALVSSIALFFKNGAGLFNEDFGIGEKYHSNEDGELILNFLNQDKKVVYSPFIEFNHPPYSAANMSYDKLYKYGIGFGALCKKYHSAALLFLFFKAIVFQLLMLLKALVLFNSDQVKRRWYALKGRLKGFGLYAN